MIYGDPLDFAVWIDEVPVWSYEVSVKGLNPYKSIEGLVSIIIDGRICAPPAGATCTLQYHLRDLKIALNDIESDITEVPVELNKNELYRAAHVPRYVDDYVSRTGMGVEIKCDLINRANWTFYLFNCKNEERLIYSQDSGQVVYEKYMPAGTVRQVLEMLPINFHAIG